MASEGTELTFRSFIEKLIEEKGIAASLDEDTKKELVRDLETKLESLVHARIIQELDEEKLTKFEKLLDQNATAEQTQEFLNTNIPKYADFVAGVLLDFRRTYLG
ncbi:MAG: DUF5663 domain-containing protein [bacterium]|nr:DUF5663 domain-containing protein [bacterium]